MEKHWAKFLPESVLGRRLENTYRNLFLRQDPAALAAAYCGTHDLSFAEPEFAGKYLDICAAYHRNRGDGAPMENAARVVEGILQGQREDGYLGGYAPGNEYASFSVWNQAFTCFGLIAYWDACRDERALHAAMRCMDGIAQGFMRPDGPMLLRSGNGGSQHLVVLLPAAQLYARTGEERYLRFCRYILDTCEASPKHNMLSNPSVLGFGSQKGIETLAFLLGMVEYGKVAHDARCIAAAQAFWQDLQEHHVGVTGCGDIAEVWTLNRNRAAMLPRDLLTNENCVAVGWMELSLALYADALDGRYYDAFERALYNHLFGSQAPDGSDFAYYQGNYGQKAVATEPTRYSCCRFRGLTMMAHLPECAVFAKAGTLALPLYASFEQVAMVDDVPVRIRMRTEYPRNGEIALEVFPQTSHAMTLLLRIPAWCEHFSLLRDGKEQCVPVQNGHAVLEGVFPPEGTRIALTLDMPVRRHREMVDDMPCIALEYGPLLLAIDSRYGTPIFSTTVDGDAAQKRLSLPREDSMPMVAFQTSGTVRGQKQDIRLVDYASAGMTNPAQDRFRVWIPETGADMRGIF